MKKFMRLFLIILGLFIHTTVIAQESKIKFDKETYSLSKTNEIPNEYDYYLKDESKDNWQTKITLANLSDLTNPTEAAAQYAHQIQAETPGASVLVYPDAAITGYITYPGSKEYYEYSTVLFQKSAKNGLDSFKFSKRFYSNNFGGAEGARKAAIEFAQQNNTKYMEMVSKTAPKYKVE